MQPLRAGGAIWQYVSGKTSKIGTKKHAAEHKFGWPGPQGDFPMAYCLM